MLIERQTVNVAKLQPGLNGNPFLLLLNFYLCWNCLQKRLGVEDGKAAQIVNLG